MSDDGSGNGSTGDGVSGFGSCCAELGEVISGEGFEPLISVGPEGILYAAVGVLELEDDEPGMIDHPIFFCPFCGTKLQDPEVVQAQITSQGELQQ